MLRRRARPTHRAASRRAACCVAVEPTVFHASTCTMPPRTHAVCRAIRYDFGRLITNPAEVCPGDLFQFKWAKFAGVTADGNHYSMYAGDRVRSRPGAGVARDGPGPTRCRCGLFTKRFSGASESSRPRLTHAVSRSQCTRAMATTRLWCTKSGLHHPVSRAADPRWPMTLQAHATFGAVMPHSVREGQRRIDRGTGAEHRTSKAGRPACPAPRSPVLLSPSHLAPSHAALSHL